MAFAPKLVVNLRQKHSLTSIACTTPEKYYAASLVQGIGRVGNFSIERIKCLLFQTTSKLENGKRSFIFVV
jgi:hypothetical protein